MSSEIDTTTTNILNLVHGILNGFNAGGGRNFEVDCDIHKIKKECKQLRKATGLPKLPEPE